MSALAVEVLERARLLVLPALVEVADRLSPELALPARYHFGWTEADGTPSLSSGGGKSVRSALALLSAEAAGAHASVGLPGALGVELVHNFSLIHDDIIDNDSLRRHRPALWNAFSLGEGVIVGDALHNLAFQQLLDDPTPARVAAAADLASATAGMIAGQSQDMRFDKQTSASVEECLQMLSRKTAALISHASAVGAILAEAPAPLVSALRRFGLEIGKGFQIMDDLLGIWGDPSVTGKPAGNDLRERKKSFPVAAALGSGGRAGAELAELLARDRLGSDEVAHAAGLVEEAGGRKAAEDTARQALEDARAVLLSSDAASDARAELLALAEFIVDREH